MTATLNDVNSDKGRTGADSSSEAAAARELVRLAKEQGLSLTGPNRLLKQFTKNVLEMALHEEMTEHLGHEKNRAADGRESSNVRSGTRSKTVLTEATGHVAIEVPRDRDGSFEPVIVKKRQRRLTGVDEIVLSLYAKGLTTGEISAHFAQIHGASVSKETVSRITDKVIEEMQTWQSRPLEQGLCRDLHRRDCRQGPRRAGCQPAGLCRHRGHAGRGEGQHTDEVQPPELDLPEGELRRLRDSGVLGAPDVAGEVAV